MSIQENLKAVIYISFIFLSISCFSQDSAENKIDKEFETLIGESNDFKEYKVVKKTDLRNLRKATNDNVSKLKDSISNINAELVKRENLIKDLELSLDKTQVSLDETTLEKSSIDFLGVSTSKSVYNLIVWSIIGLLILALIILTLRFKSSHTVTKESLLQLKTTEEELEELRSRSIEKEQKLGRQLQDERNKLARLKAE